MKTTILILALVGAIYSGAHAATNEGFQWTSIVCGLCIGVISVIVRIK